MSGSESDKANGDATESSSGSNARQNRDKLAEHLAALKAQGGKSEKPKRDRAQSEPAGGEEQPEIPKPPPKPEGWETWKQAHGNRIHSINPQDKQRMAEEADYRTLDLKPGAGKEEESAPSTASPSSTTPIPAATPKSSRPCWRLIRGS